MMYALEEDFEMRLNGCEKRGGRRGENVNKRKSN
jgi:hypothetical protein